MRKEHIYENEIGGVDKDYSISLIRFTSLIMIIACHFCQYYENEIAWWLNVGVQIFLCISGFLYGKRKSIGIIKFYKKRFYKLLIPYYIVIIIVGILHFIFVEDLSILEFGKMIIMTSTIDGGGHLWFVPTILFCYVLTPILADAFYNCVGNRNSFIFVTVLSFVISAIFCVGYANGFHPAWIGCYIIGFAIGVNEEKKYLCSKVILLIFTLLASMNVVQIYFDYIRHIEVSGSLSVVYTLWTRYNHVWLGIFIFLLLKKTFGNIKYTQRGKIFLNVADDYSYYTYLVHQFFILGVFSLVGITEYDFLNLIISLFCIVSAAIILKLLANSVYKVVERDRSIVQL